MGGACRSCDVRDHTKADQEAGSSSFWSFSMDTLEVEGGWRGSRRRRERRGRDMGGQMRGGERTGEERWRSEERHHSGLGIIFVYSPS
jgi:hypothetical protein